MEISGTVIKQSVSFLRGASETSPFSVKSRVRARQREAMAVRPWADDGHRLYYAFSARCGGTKDAKRKEEKKKAALATMLHKTMYSDGLGIDGGEGFAGDMIKGAELLLAQLNQQKAKEKEVKKRKKEEKEALKAAKMRSCVEMSSSSSSSESSDSEYEEVVAVKKVGKHIQEEVKPLMLDVRDQVHSSLEVETDEKAELNHSKLKLEQELCSNNGMGSAAVVSCRDNKITVAKSLDKIEVCMGGKCKKSGAVDLMQEFEKKVGIDGAVVGCKCMGKCKDGPNVRVVNHCSLQDELEVSKKPLCIGVGLDDVSAIVANFLGDKKIDIGLLGA